MNNTAIKFIFLLLTVGFLVSCQKNKNTGLTTSFGIVIDDSVPEDQSFLIQSDLNNIILSKFDDYEINDLNIFNIADFNNGSLISWLTARVKYVVGENYDFEEKAYLYSRRSYFPEIFSNTFKKTSVITVMSNLGSGLYLWGKAHSWLIGIEVAGRDLLIKSPRIGIIQVGPGLFSVYKIHSSKIDSFANSLLRLSVFFHEARHSDGNGDNAAFGHESCPEWHDYYGYYACDANLNGPYTIGAIMLKNAQKNCKECTNSEIQSIKIFQADSEYRVLPGSEIKDYRPEKIK